MVSEFSVKVLNYLECL